MFALFHKYILVLFYLSIFFSGCKKTDIEPPLAKEGILDLRNWDFSKKDLGHVKLNGEWEFYWECQYYSRPETCKNKHNIIIQFPKIWNGLEVDGQKLSGKGFASYRLKLLAYPGNFYAIKMLDEATAYRLWFNGKLIMNSGIPGTSPETNHPRYLPQITESFEVFEENEIVLEVSNFEHRKGGPWEAIRFGEKLAVRNYMNSRLWVDLFLTGSIFIMMIYHLGLFFLRTQEKSNLYFSLFCLIIMIRLSVTGERVFFQQFPDFDFELGNKIEYTTLYLAIPGFYLFMRRLYPDEMPLFPGYIIGVVNVVLHIMLITTKVSFYSYTVIPYQIFAVFGFVQGLVTLILSVRRNRDGAWLSMVGFIIIIIVSINDMLYSNKIIYTAYLVPYGVFAFIFFQSFVVSMRFSKAYRATEVLSKELKQANEMLDARVDERTRQLEEEKKKAEAANNAKSQFLSNMSHEIRTPMNGVMGMAQMLTNTELSLEQKEYVTAILISSRSLLTIINDILDLSKIEAGKVILEKIPFHWENSIQDIIELLYPAAKDNHDTMLYKVTDSIPEMVIGDQVKFKQILMNITGNAVKFTKNGMILIDVDLESKDNDKIFIKFQIRDTGIGITPDQMDYIFEPFTQADSSTTRKFGGTGLGLPITKKLIDLMGGTIRVQSKVGKGSNFIFTLPFEISLNETSNAKIKQIQPGKNTPYKSTKVLNILVAEDNQVNQMLIQKFLKKLGHTVTIVENGLEAVNKVAREKYDIVFLDIHMPVMDGREAAKNIIIKHGKDHPLLIAMTALAFEEEKESILSSGIEEIVHKPLELSELTEKLKIWESRFQ